jgi:hypothetical protein
MTSEGYALTNAHHQTATRTLASDGAAQRRPAPLQVVNKRTDATRWARELEAEADRSGWVADTRLAEKTTLGDLLTRYRDQVSPTKRSAHTEKARINAMVRRPIAHRTLAKLTSADIATYRDERLKDVAPATVVRELNTLNHAIETALREWGLWLPRNPVKMVRRPSVPQGRKRRLEDGKKSACSPHVTGEERHC